MSILLAAAMAQAAGSITFEIGNVRNSRGRVFVAVCTQDEFLKEDCTYNADVPARTGTTTITVPNVAAGNYAAQAFHDENGNEKVDQGFLGIPKEGVGFSRNASFTLGAPKYKSAAFAHAGRAATQRLNLRYMTGKSGPPKR